MPHIFISYSHDDADFAHVLSDQLRMAGFSTWKDDAMHAGTNWRGEIDQRIRTALAVVLIISPQSKNSVYVQYEWAFALGAGVPVVPVLKAPTAELHPQIQDIQGLDFTHYVNRPWPALIEALKARAAGKQGATVRLPGDAPLVVQEAARALDSMNAVEREAAITSLGQMNHPAAVEVLAEAVRHPIQQVRSIAGLQLTKHKDARALPAMIEAIRIRFEPVKPWMISEIGTPAVPGLINYLNDSDSDVRGAAINALGNIGGAEAAAALIASLQSADPGDRRLIMFALARTHDPGGVAAIVAKRHDTDPDVRDAVASALATCVGEGVIPALIELLRDSARDVRNSAVWSLEKLPVDATAVPVLIEALDDSYDQVASKAAKVLEKIGDPSAIPALIAHLGNEDQTVRHYVSSAVRSFGRAAAPGLRMVLNHQSGRVRAEALEALSDTGDESDVPRFLEALRDPKAGVRYYAVRALQGKRDTGVLQALIERLRDDDEDVCREAIANLQLLGDASVVPALIDCLRDESTTDAVAAAAAEALRSFGTREARAALKAWKASGAG